MESGLANDVRFWPKADMFLALTLLGHSRRRKSDIVTAQPLPFPLLRRSIGQARHLGSVPGPGRKQWSPVSLSMATGSRRQRQAQTRPAGPQKGQSYFFFGVDVLVPVLPITKISGSIFHPVIFSIGCDPIEYSLGKRASTVRSSPGNIET